MNSYTYSVLVFITCLIMIVLITMVKTSNNPENKRQKYLIAAFTFIIVGSISEWFVVMLRDGILQQFNELKVLQFMKASLRLIKFVLLPTTPFLASKALFEDIEDTKKEVENEKKNEEGKTKKEEDKKKEKERKIEEEKIKKVKMKLNQDQERKKLVNQLVEIVLGTYFMIGGILIIYGFIAFFRNEPTAFYETMMHNIYVISFIVSTAYMFINAFEFEEKNQEKHSIVLIEILLIDIIGVTIQLINLRIKTLWLTISIVSILVYLYYNLLIQNYDKPTGLLNKASLENYINNTRNEKNACTIIIMDVNYFKNINDTLGHAIGDDILLIIGLLIKKNYQQFGSCHRMGGDEFTVILRRNLDDIESINREFFEDLEKIREIYEKIPWVSIGYCKYIPEQKGKCSLINAKIIADERMYSAKEKYKTKNPSPL